MVSPSFPTQLLLMNAQSLDVWTLIRDASPVVMAVLILLATFSFYSWYIIINKYMQLGRASKQADKFLDVFWNTKKLDDIFAKAGQLDKAPVARLFRAGYNELRRVKQNGNSEASGWLGDMQSIERSLDRTRLEQMTKMESKIPFLATTGSAGPFVGLFGTVWGIMNSFRNIGAQKSAGLDTVAPGIAEALVATAIGLVAAIPAVMAYNYFVRRIKIQAAEMDAFRSDFLNIIKRHFF